MPILPSQMLLLPDASDGPNAVTRGAIAKEEALRESRSLLALSAARGIGYRSLHRWVLTGRSLTQLAELDVNSVSGEVRAAGLARLAAPLEAFLRGRERALANAQTRLERLIADGVQVIHRDETSFPEKLRYLPSGPAWLFVEGNLSRLQGPIATLVGTRKPTGSGLFCAEFVCRLLEGTDIATVSGLAAGIDQAVHRMSLNTGLPTIAVLPSSLDREYPANSMPLRADIVRMGGCLLTEYPPGEGLSRQNFVWRNRIQAALADVLIPLEWKLKSGTAHTVDFALRAGKAIVGLHLGTLPTTPENRFIVDRGGQVFRVPHEAEELLHFFCKNME